MNGGEEACAAFANYVAPQRATTMDFPKPRGTYGSGVKGHRGVAGAREEVECTLSLDGMRRKGGPSFK